MPRACFALIGWISMRVTFDRFPVSGFVTCLLAYRLSRFENGLHWRLSASFKVEKDFSRYWKVVWMEATTGSYPKKMYEEAWALRHFGDSCEEIEALGNVSSVTVTDCRRADDQFVPLMAGKGIREEREKSQVWYIYKMKRISDRLRQTAVTADDRDKHYFFELQYLQKLVSFLVCDCSQTVYTFCFFQISIIMHGLSMTDKWILWKLHVCGQQLLT